MQPTARPGRGERRPQEIRARRNPASPGCMPQGLSRPEGRRAPIQSAIGLARKGHTMTKIDQNSYATDLDDQVTNSHLTDQGYTIRHIETWHRNGHSESISSGMDPQFQKPTCRTEDRRNSRVRSTTGPEKTPSCPERPGRKFTSGALTFRFVSLMQACVVGRAPSDG